VINVLYKVQTFYLEGDNKMKAKKFMSMVMAFGLALTMGAGVARAEEPEAAKTYDLSASKLVKELTVADGIDISAVKDFTFSVTKVTEDAPEVENQTITVGTQSGGKATGNKTLDKIFPAATEFPHAGEYTYTVKETTAAINGVKDGDVTKTLTVDSSEYTVRLYVANDGTSLKFVGATVEKAGEKVDPTSEGDDGFIFKNTYKEDIENTGDNGVLKVTKTITGQYGDKTKPFPITVKLTIPGTATAADVALATGSTATLNGTTATANLADGGEIKFSKLPAGTTFTVSETQDSAYKSKITGDVGTPDTALVAGDRTNIAGTTVTASGKAVSIENNREDIIPTGVIINNLPYMLLIVIAAAGIAFFWMKKRSRA
jgi:hypothetical protein